MFSTLSQNSTIYILDKNNKPSLKLGKVTNIVLNPQYYGLTNQVLDIDVDVNGDTYQFKKVPNNLSIYSPSSGIVVSDNIEDMTREFDTMVKISQQILDSMDYHKGVIESSDEIFSILSPKYAKEKEKEIKLNVLESRVGNVEQGIGDIKSMLKELLKK